MPDPKTVCSNAAMETPQTNIKSHYYQIQSLTRISRASSAESSLPRRAVAYVARKSVRISAGVCKTQPL